MQAMYNFDNYRMLPREAQALVRRMLLSHGLRWTVANLAYEGYRFRVAHHWPVYYVEDPSTKLYADKSEPRYNVFDASMPVRRLNF